MAISTSAAATQPASHLHAVAEGVSDAVGDNHQDTGNQEATSADQGHESESNQPPYRVLGWCPKRIDIWYQHAATGQISCFKPTTSPNGPLCLAPLEWWNEHYGNQDDNGSHRIKRTQVDWIAVCSDLIEAANQVGVFAAERVRGRGVWMDRDRVVWHLGDRLEVDGEICTLSNFHSAYHYARLPALDIDPTVQPLGDSEGIQVLHAIRQMGWKTPQDHIHVVGWVVLACVGAALEKRPALQGTSPLGSGKTHLREQVLQPLLAGLSVVSSNSTEAGVRQTLGLDTLPLLLDESENENPRRRDGHLQFARLNYDGTPTSRGTTGGKALSYAGRSSVALFGINTTILNPADRSRIAVVSRVQLPQVQWNTVDQQLQELITVQTGQRLLRRVINHTTTLRGNTAVFRRVVETRVSDTAGGRAGDTYGALLAGAHLLVSTAQVDDAQAAAWLDRIGWTAANADPDEMDEQHCGAAAEGWQCLQHLLSHEEPWRDGSSHGTGRITIRELIDLVQNPNTSEEQVDQAATALGRRGIRAMDIGLAIANNPTPLKAVFGQTKWRDGSHRARLLDLDGAMTAGPVRFLALGTARACKVPWSHIHQTP